jgi:hypothetical protein
VLVIVDELRSAAAKERADEKLRCEQRENDLPGERDARVGTSEDALVFCLTETTVRNRFGARGQRHLDLVRTHFDARSAPSSVVGAVVKRVDYVVHGGHERAFHAPGKKGSSHTAWAFHGTYSAKALKSILWRNFDSRLRGTAHGQCHGPGFYLSSDASIALGFNTMTEKTLLMCNMIRGCANVRTPLDPSYCRPRLTPPLCSFGQSPHARLATTILLYGRCLASPSN